MNYKTCTYVRDTGYLCQSAAVGGREYCCYHLRHRGRQMRMAKHRARGERFDLHLPPMENMHAVQSALSQVIEALAADMIDPKRAHELLLALRQAATNFRHPEAWRASEYRNDQSAAYPASYEEFEAEYGLPEGIDLNTPPEVAFPPPSHPVGAPSSSPDFGDRVGDIGCPIPPSFDRVPLIPEIPPPYVRDYTAEAEAAFESTPADIELTEIYNTQGYKAWERRAQEHQRNADRKKQRKLFRANYARYAAEAKLKNIQAAAEKLLRERLAAEKAATQKEAAQTAQTEPVETKKPPARAVPEPAPATQKEVESIA
jgi:hypothetical protein